ncbi:hypothetical protein J3P89_27710 [Pseudomonas sp. Z1-14]|uniref:hypothetical protein n=1 Tax=Pseudomonas sp. Z1-14 TaxID=2817409 RepID=UPI003DA92695
MKTHAFPGKPPFEGFQHPFTTSVSQVQLVAPTLYRFNKPFIPHETEGIIVAVELASSHLRIYVHIPTVDLPNAATVAIEVRALDGSVSYASKPQPIVSPETLRIEVPQEDLKRFAGKKVSVRYIVQLPDEQPVGSEELFAKVTSPLDFKFPVVEGVIDSKLKVTDYPDGLDVDQSIILNLEYPSVVACRWWVSYRVEGGFPVTLYDLQQTLPVAPGLPYRFRIPPQAYAFPSEATCECVVSVSFEPHDLDAQFFGLGGHKFSFVR